MPEAPLVERVQVSPSAGAGPEGGNSAWVLPDAGIVVDPGPPGDVAFDRLVGGLRDVGVDIHEVDSVLVTHWHVDHSGLAPRLADAANARVAMHERDAPLVGDYASERERRVERDAATLARWGVPDAHVDRLRDADSPSPMPASFPVDELADGDSVGPLRVRETPGHTAGHAGFLVDWTTSAAAGAPSRTIVGDALLRTVTPNVGGGDTRQTQPLAAYRGTLDALAALTEPGTATDGSGASLALPGHGPAFALAPRVAELRAHHRERAALVHDALRSLDDEDEGTNDRATGVTPWRAARERFGDMDGYHVKFGAGEAYAHLADLAAHGLAERVADDPIRFRPTNATASEVLDDVWSA